jgi:hypothetical protein
MSRDLTRRTAFSLHKNVNYVTAFTGRKRSEVANVNTYVASSKGGKSL